jgi:hypothetical protein
MRRSRGVRIVFIMTNEGFPVADFAVRLLIDVAAIFVFAIAIYFRRHTRKDLAALFAFFNVGLFIVVTVITQAEAATAIGFGLFAILSIIRLRSEPFNNRELGYFFGALVLGLLNGIATGPMTFTLALNGVILGAIYVLDHPSVMQAAERRHVTLDTIHTDPNSLRAALDSAPRCSDSADQRRRARPTARAPNAPAVVRRAVGSGRGRKCMLSRASPCGTSETRRQRLGSALLVVTTTDSTPPVSPPRTRFRGRGPLTPAELL